VAFTAGAADASAGYVPDFNPNKIVVDQSERTTTIQIKFPTQMRGRLMPFTAVNALMGDCHNYECGRWRGIRTVKRTVRLPGHASTTTLRLPFNVNAKAGQPGMTHVKTDVYLNGNGRFNGSISIVSPRHYRARFDRYSYRMERYVTAHVRLLR